jgi:hypothetical protein
MKPSVDRPPSIWITQALLLLSIVTLLLPLLLGLFQCFSADQTLSCSSSLRITQFIFVLIALALLLLAFWGLQKGKIYGKWLAIIYLTNIVVVSIAKSDFFQIIYRSVSRWQPIPAPPYVCGEKQAMFGNFKESCGYSNYPEMILMIIADILPAALIVFLIARLLYSKAAKQFFRRSTSSL